MSTDQTTSFLRSPEWFQRLTKGDAESQWKPIPGFSCTLKFFVIVTLFSLPLGGGIFYAANQNQRITHRYDNFAAQDNADRKNLVTSRDGHTTDYTLRLNETLHSPSHRRTMQRSHRSRIPSQPNEAQTAEGGRTAQKRTSRFANYFERMLRQELDACARPIPSMPWSAAFFFLVTVVAIPFGATLYWQALENIQVVLRYDDFEHENGAFLTQQEKRDKVINDTGFITTHDFSISEKMDSPVYVYYELHGYYQNYKRYVRSLSPDQLGGKQSQSSADAQCEPYDTVPENVDDPSAGEAIYPCGLVAHSFFNDSFILNVTEDASGSPLENIVMEEEGIATEWDRKYLYADEEPRNFNDIPSMRGGGQIDGTLKEDEHFMVWMRVGARATVRKLYGIIHQDLPQGATLRFKIINRYNTYDFNGEKRLILMTSNWAGGRNEVTGIVYFVIGTLSAIACIAILGMDLRSARRPGDLSRLSWNK